MMENDVTIAIEDWGGREVLMNEAAAIANMATAKIPGAPSYLAIGTISPLPLVRPIFRHNPRLHEPEIPVGWHPPLTFLEELISRTAELRSRRWSSRHRRVMPMPANWSDLAKAAYPQLTPYPEYCRGWADLVIATVAWIAEIEPAGSEWRISDAKEKFGDLRLHEQGCETDASVHIIDAAEWIAGRCICAVCGEIGPGTLGMVRLCSAHVFDQRWRTGK